MDRRVPAGHVFVSHSTLDKPFVRRLVRHLTKAGYPTWVDEKSLLVGDPLATKIAEGIRGARAVIVVVSEASVQSNWLRFELNEAVVRMVSGTCRLIPLLLDEVEAPVEIQGILYADFRRGRRGGLNRVLAALGHDDKRSLATAGVSSADASTELPSRRAEPPSLRSPDATSRWRAIKNALKRVFYLGSASVELSPIRSIDWDIVSSKSGDRDTPYKTVMRYHTEEVITRTAWDDWQRVVTEEYGEDSSLLISEHPLDRRLEPLLVRQSEGVYVEDREGLFAVFVDANISEEPELDRRLRVVAQLLSALDKVSLDS
jgi:hypothetical protein